MTECHVWLSGVMGDSHATAQLKSPHILILFGPARNMVGVQGINVTCGGMREVRCPPHLLISLWSVCPGRRVILNLCRG